MYFENLAALWQMSGHGIYVWSAYAACTGVFMLLLLHPFHAYRQQMEKLQRLQFAVKNPVQN